MWDFGDPAASENRFLAAMAGASENDKLILQTQVARSYGIRKDFEHARDLLATIQSECERVGGEPLVRYCVELGRSWCSATHPAESRTPEALECARVHYLMAFDVAKAAELDYLAIDALHMMAFVDDSPEGQLKWDLAALDFMEKSPNAEAKKWEGSLRNNIGYALHLLGRYDEALAEFEKSLAARLAVGNASGARVAKWMIAWTKRVMGRTDEALFEQLELEKECADAGAPDPYVFEELETLYREMGDEAKAEHYISMRN